MADPRRYYIEPVLVLDDGVSPRATTVADESPSGEWIKWHDFEDYKAGQTRNKSENTATRLGLEIVHLRTQLQQMTKVGDRMAKMIVRMGKGDGDEYDAITKVVSKWADAKAGNDNDE